MCRRANEREAFGGPLAEKQFVQDFIAKLARWRSTPARLMVLHAAWKMDTEGKRAARQEISMIKVVAAQHAHGGARPRDAGARRARDVRTTRRWPPCGARAAAAHRRRAGRGAQDGHRAARAEPLQGRRTASPSHDRGHRRPARPQRRAAARSSRRSATSARASSWRAARSENGHSRRRSPRRMGELGWYGLQIPEEYGGSGGSFLDATLFLEEFTPRPDPGRRLRRHADRGRARSTASAPRSRSATCSGRVVEGGTLAIAMSEPEAGSDVASLKTAARAATTASGC